MIIINKDAPDLRLPDSPSRRASNLKDKISEVLQQAAENPRRRQKLMDSVVSLEE